MHLKELETVTRVVIYALIINLGSRQSTSDDAGLIFLWLVCWDLAVFATTFIPKLFVFINEFVSKE